MINRCDLVRLRELADEPFLPLMGDKEVIQRAADALTEAQQQIAALKTTRDTYWAELCEVKAGTGVVPEALYDEAMKRAARAEAKLAGQPSAGRAE